MGLIYTRVSRTSAAVLLILAVVTFLLAVLLGVFFLHGLVQEASPKYAIAGIVVIATLGLWMLLFVLAVVATLAAHEWIQSRRRVAHQAAFNSRTSLSDQEFQLLFPIEIAPTAIELRRVLVSFLGQAAAHRIRPTDSLTDLCDWAEIVRDSLDLADFMVSLDSRYGTDIPYQPWWTISELAMACASAKPTDVTSLPEGND